jgi:glycosyltransferase involved in cell wall biosynthesis
MIVYLSNPYGTIPGEDWREYRFFLLAKALAAEGHQVVWFTSTFSHHFKKQRFNESKIININNNFKIHLVKSRGYKNNFSFGRILKDLTYGLRLMTTLKKEYARPDLFFIADSPILFYYPSYWYCKNYKIPYVVDQMDLWPELIVNSFPNFVRPFVNLICTPIYIIRKRVFAHCTGFISLAKKYLDVPKGISKNISEIPNAVIYNGINVDEFRSNMTNINKSTDLKVGCKDKDEIWFIFAGTLGPSYDLKTILQGFANLNNKNCKLIIAGDGSEKGYVETFIDNNKLDNVNYLGKISKEALPYLYSKCDVGLNCYGAYSNVEMSDKFYDYTAAGLAILNSLEGEVYKLVIDNRIGFNYKASCLNSFQNSLNEIIKNKNLQEFKDNSYKLGAFFDQKEQLNKFKRFVCDLNMN